MYSECSFSESFTVLSRYCTCTWFQWPCTNIITQYLLVIFLRIFVLTETVAKWPDWLTEFTHYTRALTVHMYSNVYSLSLLLSIACISKFSSGQVFYYPDFHHTKEVPRTKFEKDFRWMVTSFRLWYTSVVLWQYFWLQKCRRACNMYLYTHKCTHKYVYVYMYVYGDWEHICDAHTVGATCISHFSQRRYLTRRIGFEAVMRMRCTEGKVSKCSKVAVHLYGPTRLRSWSVN